MKKNEPGYLLGGFRILAADSLDATGLVPPFDEKSLFPLFFFDSLERGFDEVFTSVGVFDLAPRSVRFNEDPIDRKGLYHRQVFGCSQRATKNELLPR